MILKNNIVSHLAKMKKFTGVWAQDLKKTCARNVIFKALLFCTEALAFRNQTLCLL
jgi:hypothetical protein